MEISKMTISEAYVHLQPIAQAYGLRLNRATDFKFARIILVNLYNRELIWKFLRELRNGLS
jgi:hypothetical protein